jgi:iron complex outermembrane receptor protein
MGANEGSFRPISGAVALAMCAASVFASAGPADDQSVPRPPQQDAQDPLVEIVVTGSRIARPEFERLQPTTVVTSEFFERRAYNSILDALDELPQFGEPDSSTMGRQALVGAGQSFANLFTLGSNHTLTLVDGRRFVPATSPSGSSATGAGGEQVDLNVIPTLLLDRIEVIAVGGAPIYGSDAIAGTVNIILKHDYEGMNVDAGAGISNRGDAAQSRLRLLGGKNFADGRANIEVSAEIASSQGLVGRQRPQIENAVTYLPASGNSLYQFVLAPNQLVGGISPSGVPLTNDGYLDLNPNFAITSPTGQVLAFNNGHLAPWNPGPTDSTGYLNNGGDGLNQNQLATLLTPQERINGTVLGHFQLTERVRLFGEFWYSETHTLQPPGGAGIQSSLSGEPAGQISGNLILSVNNPFLSSADQATIANNLRAYAAIPGNPTQTSVFYLTRIDEDAEPGSFTADQNTKRVVLGFDGKIPAFGRELNYEVSGIYGETISNTTVPLLNFQNLSNALNAVLSPNGTIICAPGYTNSAVPTQSSTCAPFNPFGNGIASRAALNYVTGLAQATSKISQRIFNASMNGELLKLPAGTVRFAAGYENRHESAGFAPDQSLQQGTSVEGTIPPVEGAFTTNEIFGELLVPIVAPSQEIPAVHRIEVESAVREVDHSVAGKATTWTAGLRFEPLSVIQLRGNYTRAIRAPSVTEAFTPISFGFGTASDPCDQQLINTGPNPKVRAANCAAAGITQPFNSFVLNVGAPFSASGNGALQNETADSRTFGIVFRPLPKMSLTVDYVSIDIRNAIHFLDATRALDSCYDNPVFPNPACNNITRNVDGQVTFIKTEFANFGFLDSHDIVSEFDYSFDVPFASVPGGFGVLDIRMNYVYDNLNTISYGSSAEAIIGQGTLGLSKHNASIAITWSKDTLYTLWQTRYVGSALFANQFPANFSQPSGVGQWWVHNLTLGYAPSSHFNLQLVVNNVFDRQQPQPLPAIPPITFGFSGFQTYFSGVMGRYFSLSASYKL